MNQASRGVNQSYAKFVSPCGPRLVQELQSLARGQLEASVTIGRGLRTCRDAAQQGEDAASRHAGMCAQRS